MLSSFEELFRGTPGNPYLQQLLKGFAWLRFEPQLEREYDQYLGAAAIRQRRIAIVLALLIWCGFVAVDLHRLQPFNEGVQLSETAEWLLHLRWAVLGLLVGAQLMILVKRLEFLTLPMTPWVIALTGIVTALINMLYSRLGMQASYDGVILLTIAAFFPLGMTFYTSLMVGLAISIGSFLLAQWLLIGDYLRAFNLTTVYLFLGVLVSAGGGYLRDHNQREQFLSRHLLNWLAERDSLTGLYNRRSLEQKLAVLFLQARRQKCRIGLVLVDLDHFKAYNDSYGHRAGDLALQRVARVLHDFARRPLDMAVRLGGEEFALLLFDCDEQALHGLAEEVRLAIEQLAIEHRGSATLPVMTASLGMALSVPEESSGTLYQRADEALYRAKHAGRNQVLL